MALLVAAFMPENPHNASAKKQKVLTAQFELQEEGAGEMMVLEG